MSPRKLVAVSAACIVLVSAFLLVTGSPVLATVFPGLANLPLGTLIAWVGAVSLPLCIYAALNRLHPTRTSFDRGMARVMWSLIALAVAWAPVSLLLSGNLAFEFRGATGFQGSGAALFVFFYYSMALIVLPFAALALYGLLSVILRRRS